MIINIHELIEDDIDSMEIKTYNLEELTEDDIKELEKLMIEIETDEEGYYNGIKSIKELDQAHLEDLINEYNGYVDSK